MSTFVSVFYFSEDHPDLVALDRAIDTLAADWVDRSQFIHPRARIAGDLRIDNLRNARALLVEPVPRSHGG